MTETKSAVPASPIGRAAAVFRRKPTAIDPNLRAGSALVTKAAVVTTNLWFRADKDRGIC